MMSSGSVKDSGGSVRPAYPAHREADIVLRDGSTIHVRPIRPEDRDAILRFFQGLTDESRYFRYFSGRPDLERAADDAVEVDYRDRFGLVATAGVLGDVVAHGVYLLVGPERAEIALAVADAFQERGLGTLLIGQLAEAAHSNGVSVLEAKVLPQNFRMVEVFRESGFPVDTRWDIGEISVEFPTSLTGDALERFERREQIAAVAAVGGMLQPRSVAVVGASRSRGTIGGEVFHNLLSAGFDGPVYPINPSAEVVQSVPAYRSVKDIPGPVDLAVIVVPARAVAAVATECAEKGVRGLV